MNIRASLVTSIWLLTAVLVTYVLAERTGHVLFTWLGSLFSIWVFLNLYWLGICIVDHMNTEAFDSPSVVEEEATLRIETPYIPSNEIQMPSHPSHNLRQTTSK